jgi:hypothetical protein
LKVAEQEKAGKTQREQELIDMTQR